MLISYQDLSTDALNNLIDEFVLREGTEYGESDFSLAEKSNSVLLQIKEKEVLILYSELDENVTLITKTKFNELSAFVDEQNENRNFD